LDIDFECRLRQRGRPRRPFGTFPIGHGKDEAPHSYYHTGDTILTIYDALTTATTTGAPYHTLLDPTPDDPRCRHP
jgi:hypothetical protein